jgi:hypothetical protein
MLPEPTLPEPSAAPLAVARPPSITHRNHARGAARKDPPDLLEVTPERFRRALWHSFLRYGVSGDLNAAVHAAMNVLGPVLAARDAEIAALREAATGAQRPPRSRSTPSHRPRRRPTPAEAS